VPLDFLHSHRNFSDLIRIVADERRIDPALVEKGQWVYTELHYDQAWREVLATAVLYSDGSQMLTVMDSWGRGKPYTVPRGREVLVRDTEDG